MESIVSKAAIFAAKAHDGQRRKAGGGAYILHPLEAAVIAASLTDDEDVIAAALLHDRYWRAVRKNSLQNLQRFIRE